MSQSYEMVGKVVLVGDTEQISDKFKKREIRVEIDGSTEYPQIIPVEFTQDKTSALDGINEGDNVTVTFNLKGRVWNDRCFGSFQGWKISANAAPAAGVPDPVREPVEEDPDDIPFNQA